MSRTTDLRPLPDQHGRRAVVTGASDGMGVVIATRLAAAGAEVVLPVRNREKGRAALARIEEQVPGARASLRDLDLSSLASAAALCETLREEGDPVHLLVLNAGVMTPPGRTTTADGLELQLGTNHVGHVALVGHLMPLLRAGGARVTWQSSVAARRGHIDWDDLQAERHYDGMRAYAGSKIAMGLFGLELDRRSRAGGWGVSSNVAHPGVAPTNLLAARPEVGRPRDTPQVRIVWVLSRVGLAGTPASAAEPALLAVTDPDGGGRFYGPRGPGGVGGPPAERTPFPPLRDEAEAARVFEVSADLAGVTFPDAA